MSLELSDQYDKIYTFCYFKVQNRDIAEDLTQETFLRYFSQTSYVNKGKPLAYLYTIAKNCCTDYYRKTKTVPITEELSALDEISPLEDNLVIKTAINKLAHDQQELLLLRFTNELGLSEIGSILNLSRFAVYRKLNATLKELKPMLGEEKFL